MERIMVLSVSFSLSLSRDHLFVAVSSFFSVGFHTCRTLESSGLGGTVAERLRPSPSKAAVTA
jgi:hypothetical protein